MAKDRLNEFQMRMAEYEKGEKNVNATGGNQPNKSKQEKKTLEKAEALQQSLQAIEQNLDEIRQYLTRIEDIRYNRKDVQEKIDSLFQKNTSTFQQITVKLKQFQSALDPNDESAQGRIEQIQFNSLKIRFQETFKHHSTELENYKRKQTELYRAQLKAKGDVYMSDDELTKLIDEGKAMQVFSGNLIAETAEARRVLADIEERHDQIIKIERMLTEVRDLFVQMAVLVDTQGEAVNRVEYQARAARDFIGSGITELNKAKKKKKTYLKRKIWCASIIVVIIIILIVGFLIPR